MQSKRIVQKTVQSLRLNMRLLILILSITFSQNIMASTLKLNYSLFFGYMKTMYKLDYQYVTTSFFLVEQETGKQCNINNAEIVVDDKREKIEFEKNGQLLPFYSDQHRKDGAMIEVESVDNISCALQVTLMAKQSELTMLPFEKLVIVSTELEGVLRKNAGMIGKYFLPEYAGLRLRLMEPITSDVGLPEGYKLSKEGDLLVTNKALTSADPDALLPYQVSKITPWIGQ